MGSITLWLYSEEEEKHETHIKQLLNTTSIQHRDEIKLRHIKLNRRYLLHQYILSTYTFYVLCNNETRTSNY